MRKIVLILILFALKQNNCLSQNNKCKTKVRKDYPVLLNNDQKPDENKVWNVPVVFHVLYKTEEQNVPDSLVIGVLETLQLDFSGQNSDINLVPEEFKSLVGNPNIRFALAEVLPSGESTTGIIRQKTKRNEFKLKRRDMFEESRIIDSKSYLNVYICNTNTNAFTPTTNIEMYDGVVIDFKRVFKGSRTLTHEAGHWLDLRHIFDGDCKNTDGVADTRAQKQHSINDCHKYPLMECGNSVMFMNFMDYSSCRYFFTIGQVDRMRKYIVNYKKFN